MQSANLGEWWGEGSVEQGGRDPATALVATALVLSSPSCHQLFSIVQWFHSCESLVSYYSCVNMNGILTLLGFTLHLGVDLWKLMLY